MPSQGRLQGKRILLLGAASGMGLACAKLFAVQGARLFLADLSETGLEATSKEIVSEGGTVDGHKVSNITKSADMDAMVKAAEAAMGGIDVAINWAGIPDKPGPVHECSVDLWDRVVAVNLDGPFYFSRAVLPALERSGGNLVLIGSVAGHHAAPGNPSYSAAKGGAVMMGKALAIEYADQGVRVNVICPAAVDTPLLDQMFADEGLSKEDVLKAEPARRFCLAVEQAQTALFLSSDDAAYVSGVVITVDRGYGSQ